MAYHIMASFRWYGSMVHYSELILSFSLKLDFLSRVHRLIMRNQLRMYQLRKANVVPLILFQNKPSSTYLNIIATYFRTEAYTFLTLSVSVTLIEETRR